MTPCSFYLVCEPIFQKCFHIHTPAVCTATKQGSKFKLMTESTANRVSMVDCYHYGSSSKEAI